jgi:hypothetical protein
MALAYITSKKQKQCHQEVIMLLNKDLLTRIAHLESVNDQLLTELSYIDTQLKLVGFPEGLETVKVAAAEIIEEQRSYSEEDDIAM